MVKKKSFAQQQVKSNTIPILELLLHALLQQSTTAYHWYYDEGAPSLDACDHLLKWRACNNQVQYDTLDSWRELTFMGEGTHVPH
jgi:hypothetical protein